MPKTMSISGFCAALLCASLAFPALGAAEKIKYLGDPVYEKMAPEDGHPMDDMQALAAEGDMRAQFILGDLYSKGKGGLPKKLSIARKWFEESAFNGYPESFIRLAALEKRVKKPAEAYKWYTLCMEHLRGDGRKWCQKSRDELAKSAPLSKDQMKAAKQDAGNWYKNKKEQKLKKTEAVKEAEKIKKSALELQGPPESTVTEKKEVLTAAEALTAEAAHDTPAANTDTPDDTSTPLTQKE
jgi:TPR repeat protein